jgi:hypothetical protein
MNVKAAIFVGDELKEKISDRAFVFHAGVGKGISLHTDYHYRRTGGGDRALIDGALGSEDLDDGFWQGYEQDDLTAVIDLGGTRLVNSVSIRCAQDLSSWIFLPARVGISLSEDGLKYERSATIKNDISAKKRGVIIKEFAGRVPGKRARYVRIKAENLGVLPKWHRRAGEKCWLFADEIIIR